MGHGAEARQWSEIPALIVRTQARSRCSVWRAWGMEGWHQRSPLWM